MALCCIGGICIPYSAIIPLMIYGFRWLFQKLVEYGVVPSWISQSLSGILSFPQKNHDDEKNGACCNATTCDSTTQSSSSGERRGKHVKHSTSTTTSCTTTTATEDDETEIQNNHNQVVMLNDLEQWNRMVTRSHRETTIFICKFTASWCKPCRQIQPVYESLAKEYGSTNHHKMRFVCIDADADDFQDLVHAYGVMTLPSFVAMQTNQNHNPQERMMMMDKYSGSDANKLRRFVEVLAEKQTKIQ